jgi:hypothetical protein
MPWSAGGLSLRRPTTLADACEAVGKVGLALEHYETACLLAK